MARAPNPKADGMVIDFGELKRITNDLLERLDHHLLNEIKPFDEIEPSAENLAEFIFNEVEQGLGERGDLLYSVGVWESDTSVARYFR